jgi:UDP-N-acetyl-D-mannosaminuronic acid dehydrogenase
LIQTAREVNDSKPYWVIEKVKLAVADYLVENADKSVSDIKIACYGLAFKPDIDDLRESPSLMIARSLSKQYKMSLICVEPNIPIDTLIDGVNLVSLESAKADAVVHVLLVDHREFKEVGAPNGKIVDIKGLWSS